MPSPGAVALAGLGLTQGDHHGRAEPDIRDLSCVRLARDEDRRAVPAEPDGNEMRRVVRTDAAQPDDRLAPQKPIDSSGWSQWRDRVVHGWIVLPRGEPDSRLRSRCGH